MFHKIIKLTSHVAELTQVMLRVVVYSQEVYHLPAASQGIKVVSGQAWLTIGGKDIIVKAGDRVLLNSSDMALISALGTETLMLEVLTASESARQVLFGWGRLLTTR
jgi:quercetin dioxygenase-like cupin family protein